LTNANFDMVLYYINVFVLYLTEMVLISSNKNKNDFLFKKHHFAINNGTSVDI